jgi:hypothetical protein
MPRTGWTPGTVSYGADQTAYLLIDRFHGLGVYRETESSEQTSKRSLPT